MIAGGLRHFCATNVLPGATRSWSCHTKGCVCTASSGCCIKQCRGDQRGPYQGKICFAEPNASPKDCVHATHHRFSFKPFCRSGTIYLLNKLKFYKQKYLIDKQSPMQICVKKVRLIKHTTNTKAIIVYGYVDLDVLSESETKGGNFQ